MSGTMSQRGSVSMGLDGYTPGDTWQASSDAIEQTSLASGAVRRLTCSEWKTYRGFAEADHPVWSVVGLWKTSEPPSALIAQFRS